MNDLCETGNADGTAVPLALKIQILNNSFCKITHFSKRITTIRPLVGFKSFRPGKCNTTEKFDSMHHESIRPVFKPQGRKLKTQIELSLN